jgi:gliding motility-associated-like protein
VYPASGWSGLSTGTHTIKVRNASGCETTLTQDIGTAPSAPEVTVEDKILCEGSSVQLTALPAGGSWTGNQVSNGVFNSSGLPPGVYSINYTVSANGCSTTKAATVTVKAKTSSFTTITICSNQLPYNWNGNFYTQPGTYTFISVNQWGCDSIATLVLTVSQIITGPTDSITICETALPYQWHGQSITQAGTYSATLQNAAGCDSVVKLVLATSPLAMANITGGNPICPGANTTISITLTGSAPWTITYSDGTTTHIVNNIISSPYKLIVSPTQTTTYSLLSVTDLKCSNTNLTGSVTVTVLSSQSGVRYPDVFAIANVPRNLQARNLGNGSVYQWSPSIGLNNYLVINPVFTYDSSIQYIITITNGTGCTIVDTVRVLVSSAAAPLTSDIFVPKAWSPNKDGHNDLLRPLTVHIKQIYYFRIFNRWGQLLYETNMIGKGWDGIYKGAASVQDVYTWTLEAMGEDGKRYKKSGSSILLR